LPCGAKVRKVWIREYLSIGLVKRQTKPEINNWYSGNEYEKKLNWAICSFAKCLKNLALLCALCVVAASDLRCPITESLAKVIFSILPKKEMDIVYYCSK
jgi:hypothetical protein